MGRKTEIMRRNLDFLVFFERPFPLPLCRYACMDSQVFEKRGANSKNLDFFHFERRPETSLQLTKLIDFYYTEPRLHCLGPASLCLNCSSMVENNCNSLGRIRYSFTSAQKIQSKSRINFFRGKTTVLWRNSKMPSRMHST